MVPPEAPAADPVVNEMRVESERRLKAYELAAKPVASVPATSVDEGKPKGGSTATEKVAEAPAADKAHATPETAATEDLSDFPEEFRSPEKQATPEFRKWLRKELADRGLRQADYTKKTTEVAEQRKAIEAAKSRLEFAEAVLSDKDYLDAIEAVRAKKTTPEKAEPFDYLSATSEQIAEHEAGIERRAVEKAKAETLAAIDNRQSKATAEQLAIMETVATARAEFIDSGEYTQDEVAPVYDSLVDMGVALTKENVVKALRLGLPKREPKSKDKPSTNGAATEKVAVGASVLTRKSGTSPTLVTPVWVREHRAPANASERLQETLLRRNAERAARGLDPYTL